MRRGVLGFPGVAKLRGSLGPSMLVALHTVQELLDAFVCLVEEGFDVICVSLCMISQLISKTCLGSTHSRRPFDSSLQNVLTGKMPLVTPEFNPVEHQR